MNRIFCILFAVFALLLNSCSSAEVEDHQDAVVSDNASKLYESKTVHELTSGRAYARLNTDDSRPVPVFTGCMTVIRV